MHRDADSPVPDAPSYTVGGAASLLGLSLQLTRRLLAVLPGAGTGPFGFLTLMEIHVLRVIARGAAGPSLSAFAEWAGDVLGRRHPLVRREFLDAPEAFLGATRPRAERRHAWLPPRAVEVAVRDLRRVRAAMEFEPGASWPSRWWPHGTGGSIVLDPAVQGGAPTVAGTRIRTSLAALHVGRRADAARNWGVSEEWILAARTFEEGLRASAGSSSMRRSTSA